MRVGLFGGTFNPIHIGHLRAAVEVREAFTLDKLLFVPSAYPPHKSAEGMASAQDRFEMVRRAIENVPSFEVSDVELVRPGPSYTIETLQYFRDYFGSESTIYFVLGLDAFSEVTTWKSYHQLFVTAHFIIMARPGPGIKDLESFIHTYISQAYQYDAKLDQYTHPDWCSIFCTNITHLDISATQTRKRIRDGGSILFLVSQPVEEYIQEKGLYR